MLIIPLEQKLDANRPPVATVLLIIINCMVFFGYQANDYQHIEQAAAYYQEQGLLQYEAPVYTEFLQREDPELYQDYRTLAEEEVGPWIMQDARFTHYLNNTYFPGNANLPLPWLDARLQLDAMIGQLSFIKYGMIPADINPLDVFVSMFLHGDIGHLLGNMLFLFVYGFSLEVALGRLWFLGIYLFSGIAGSLLTWAVTPDSLVPTVGASGAIFGLLGMYLGLYGMKKIHFFWSVGFYAHYFKAPALVLLPYWGLIELYDQFTQQDNVAHFVHIGGLLAGFAAVYAAKDRLIKVDHAYVDKVDADEPYKKLYDKLLRQLEAIDFQAAKRSLQELLKMRPGESKLLKHQFDLWKLKPANAGFEEAARQIFSQPPLDVMAISGLQYLVSDYERLSTTHSALTPKERINLFNAFLKSGELDAAVKQYDAIADAESAQAKIPNMLLRLGTFFAAQSKFRKAEIYLDKLKDKYPDSEAAQEARKIKF